MDTPEMSGAHLVATSTMSDVGARNMNEESVAREGQSYRVRSRRDNNGLTPVNTGSNVQQYTDLVPAEDTSIDENASASLTTSGLSSEALLAVDSDLSDLSELSETEIAMLGESVSNRSVPRAVLKLKFSAAVPKHHEDPEEKNEDQMMDVDDLDLADSYREFETMEVDTGGARPQKRMRMSNSKTDTTVVATHAAQNDIRESPPAAHKQITPPIPSPPLAASNASTISILSDIDELAPLSTDTLPTALEQSVQLKSVQLKSAQPSAATNPTLKMTILPKAEVENLKTHNGILRSHNLSLARQNLTLRHDNANAILLYQEVKDNGPIDHSGCVRKNEYDEVTTENDAMRVEMSRLRYEHQLMQECGMEWAKRENMWEIEKGLFTNEVSECVARVQELEAREQQLIGRVQEFVGRAQYAEQQFAAARARAAVLEEQVVQMQVYIQSLGQVLDVTTRLGNGDQDAFSGP